MIIPSISAIIIFFNDRGIFEIITSAKNQKYPFSEIIVVDDGSNYQLNEEVKIYCKNIGNLKFITIDKNSGIPSAMKEGILRCNCDYFYLMSCGDMYQDDLLKHYYSINWNNGFPGIIASGIYTLVEGENRRAKYLQDTKKNVTYINEDYKLLLKNSSNLFYGGGCIVHHKIAIETLQFFCRLEWAADFFMYYYVAYKKGVIFSNQILMTNLIHNNRYSTLIDRKKTLKIVREYVNCCNKIDDKFYEFISSSNLIPAYSIRIAIDILIRSDMRGFLKPRTILRCVTHDLGRIISPITPLKVKNVLRKNLKL